MTPDKLVGNLYVVNKVKGESSLMDFEGKIGEGKIELPHQTDKNIPHEQNSNHDKKKDEKEEKQQEFKESSGIIKVSKYTWVICDYKWS